MISILQMKKPGNRRVKWFAPSHTPRHPSRSWPNFICLRKTQLTIYIKAHITLLWGLLNTSFSRTENVNKQCKGNIDYENVYLPATSLLQKQNLSTTCTTCGELFQAWEMWLSPHSEKPVGSEVGGQDPHPWIGSPVGNQACIVTRLLWDLLLLKLPHPGLRQQMFTEYL